MRVQAVLDGCSPIINVDYVAWHLLLFKTSVFSLLSRPSFADGIHSRRAIKHSAWNLIGEITHVHMRLTQAPQKLLICHFPENIPQRNNKLQLYVIIIFFVR